MADHLTPEERELPDAIEEMLFESDADIHQAACRMNCADDPDECNCAVRRLIEHVYTYATAFTVAQRDEALASLAALQREPNR